jgi:hypothetical protein
MEYQLLLSLELLLEVHQLSDHQVVVDQVFENEYIFY